MDPEILRNPRSILKKPIPDFCSVSTVLKRCFVSLEPPVRIMVSEAAAKFRKLNNRGGGVVGDWSNDITPYMVEPANMLNSRAFPGVVFMGPAQTGKTDALILNGINYRVTSDPGNMLVIQTSQAVAREFVKEKVDGMHNASRALKDRLMAGSSNDNAQEKRYSNGMSVIFGWPSQTMLSGKSVPWVLMTDYDRFPRNIDGQGEAFGMGVKRTQTFGSRGVCLAESSPGELIIDGRWRETPGSHEVAPAPGIASLYNSGDRRRWWWPCPNCGEYFEGSFSDLKWAPEGGVLDRADTVVMVCPCCAFRISQTEKYEMNLRGKWVPEGCHVTKEGELKGQARRSNIASFHLQGTAAGFQSWRDLVVKWLTAVEDYRRTGEEESMKTTINVDQGRSYLPIALREENAITAEDLKERAEDYPLGVVPKGVRYLTAFADVQKSMFVVQVVGWGAERERWVIDRFNLTKSERVDEDGDPLPLDPAGYIEDWSVLVNGMILKSYPLSDGSDRRMTVRISGTDSSGEAGVTENAYRFWRKMKRARLGRRFVLLKGDKATTAARFRLTYPDSNRKDRRANANGEIPVYLLGTNILKDGLWGDLCRMDPGPGYIHHSKDLSDSFFAEALGERRGAKGWEPVPGVRNETFDLHVYNRVGSALLKDETIKWDAPPDWAKSWDENSYVSSPPASEVLERVEVGPSVKTLGPSSSSKKTTLEKLMEL